MEEALKEGKYYEYMQQVKAKFFKLKLRQRITELKQLGKSTIKLTFSELIYSYSQQHHG